MIMRQEKEISSLDKHADSERILLINLPFWTPLIPAQGIASLKSFLQPYGYNITTVDAASENMFLEYYNNYFETMRKMIPIQQQGNFYNIGHDTLRNHMMAHTNYQDENRYHNLVKDLVYHTFYYRIDDTQMMALIDIVQQLYDRLQQFIFELMDRYNPSILGLSATSGNLPATKFVFEIARKRNPKLRTVMGGCVFFNHLAVGNPDLDTFLEKTEGYLDKLIIGKGEVLFLKYLRGQLPEHQRVFTQEHLSKEETRLYSFDIPDMSDFNLENFFYLAATASSSCPYNCSFCNSQSFFGKYKKRDTAHTVKDMIRLQKKHGHKLFFMTDSLLNPIIANLSGNLIAADIQAYFDGYFFVDDATCNIDNTLQWRKGGFYRARLGTESGSQRVLDMMGKPITPEKTKLALAALAEAGIKTTTYWVIGHPDETEEDFQMTLDLIAETKNDIWEAECNPFTYHYVGQTKSDMWADKRISLYSQDTSDLLISQTWVLDHEPRRDVIYDRMFRFIEHCKKLGVPNPYSVDEINRADERWKKLHKNAVPTVMEIMNNSVPADEKKHVKKRLVLQPKEQDDGDFGF
jgi:Radical SAM superfamily